MVERFLEAEALSIGSVSLVIPRLLELGQVLLLLKQGGACSTAYLRDRTPTFLEIFRGWCSEVPGPKESLLTIQKGLIICYHCGQSTICHESVP